MSDEICIWFGEDGKAHAYNSEFDVTIHCENEREMNDAVALLNLANRLHWRKTDLTPPTEEDAEDHEYAVNKLCRIVEQALQEELKVADESKRTEFLSVSGITPHDYGEIMTAVHLARKDRSVPIAVLSQSEIDRRMGKLKRA